MSFIALYQQIEDLSAEIAMLTDKDEFEHVEEKLAFRLTLLKRLADEVRQAGNEADEVKLHEFLLNVQAQDKVQVDKLVKERAKSLAEGQKQSKTKKAVNTYQIVSDN
ncbi:hypothetical protein Q4489_05450 [Thalassotalea sp. 1_MG-2023]|uniref:hypothetical protein n=1 Tax=Thalassotalea sp. 1_MG-2023 TaxID=3062680 RepID=UPI0026E2FFFE|nr:hypothetical protein [Thalassotalea sp. 1_MG-2023]MDO6426447.1 hypothetical protein [Thalassotalea sp. 1_MG-2023]